jgi:hypothetical protein
MSAWAFVQTDPSEKLAKLHLFSVMKRQGDREVEFRITVREYATPQPRGMHFFADTDKQVNQSVAPFTPYGWGSSLSQALAECMKNIARFPFDDPNQVTDSCDTP